MRRRSAAGATPGHARVDTTSRGEAAPDDQKDEERGFFFGGIGNHAVADELRRRAIPRSRVAVEADTGMISPFSSASRRRRAPPLADAECRQAEVSAKPARRPPDRALASSHC